MEVEMEEEGQRDPPPPPPPPASEGVTEEDTLGQWDADELLEPVTLEVAQGVTLEERDGERVLEGQREVLGVAEGEREWEVVPEPVAHADGVGVVVGHRVEDALGVKAAVAEALTEAQEESVAAALLAVRDRVPDGLPLLQALAEAERLALRVALVLGVEEAEREA